MPEDKEEKFQYDYDDYDDDDDDNDNEDHVLLPGCLHVGRCPRRQPYCAPTFLWAEIHTHTHTHK